VLTPKEHPDRFKVVTDIVDRTQVNRTVATMTDAALDDDRRLLQVLKTLLPEKAPNHEIR
jgi:hypothetical protein